MVNKVEKYKLKEGKVIRKMNVGIICFEWTVIMQFGCAFKTFWDELCGC